MAKRRSTNNDLQKIHIKKIKIVRYIDYVVLHHLLIFLFWFYLLVDIINKGLKIPKVNQKP